MSFLNLQTKSAMKHSKYEIKFSLYYSVIHEPGELCTYSTAMDCYGLDISSSRLKGRKVPKYLGDKRIRKTFLWSQFVAAHIKLNIFVALLICFCRFNHVVRGWKQKHFFDSKFLAPSCWLTKFFQAVKKCPEILLFKCLLFQATQILPRQASITLNGCQCCCCFFFGGHTKKVTTCRNHYLFVMGREKKIGTLKFLAPNQQRKQIADKAIIHFFRWRWNKVEILSIRSKK